MQGTNSLVVRSLWYMVTYITPIIRSLEQKLSRNGGNLHKCINRSEEKECSFNEKKNHVIPMLPKEPAYNVMRQGYT
jgi:hypothetical protein